jgi:hypothetical protein
LRHWWVTLALAALPAVAQEIPSVEIPRLERAPTIEEFLSMEAPPELTARMLKVSGYFQLIPRNLEPSTQRTDTYLGYDDNNLYAVFVCFETHPERVRARMERRENIFQDDLVEVMVDTFRDQRRAYSFVSNPLGVQADGVWTEGRGYDFSFDTIFHTRGKLTAQGYVVWMAIPFRSLRFSPGGNRPWGLILSRFLPRSDTTEDTYWPAVSQKIQGRLNQAAPMNGLSGISPGRNMQFVPYGVFRSFRARESARECLEGVCGPTAVPARFVNDRAAPDGGLDAKFVLKDSLVLDVALNPDFSQVESDQPQVVVNQRFEVFFPEKRPFFLENANYFRTPIDLLFTRRIADPQFGVRLTGKMGRWAVGALFADDQSPGRSVLPDHPLFGERARFGVVRINREVFSQSSIGVMVTDREFQGSFNRVGGFDARIRLPRNWLLEGQALASSTKFLDGSRIAGPGYFAKLEHNGEHFFNNLTYRDFSPGFTTSAGFVNRTDIRNLGNFAQYTFKPNNRVVNWGVNGEAGGVWDHAGTRLDAFFRLGANALLSNQTTVSASTSRYRERLRPQDFSGLASDIDFARADYSFSFFNSYFQRVTFGAGITVGDAVNVVPSSGPPLLGRQARVSASLTFRPMNALRVDNNYLLSRLTEPGSGAAVFNNHIIRSRWNWQFNRELSLRVIGQYDVVLANDSRTFLESRKNFNVDFLVTYLVHPGTAIYVGYNSNLQNLEPDLQPGPTGSARTRSRFINDAKQVFVKASYLFRF